LIEKSDFIEYINNNNAMSQEQNYTDKARFCKNWQLNSG
jgi:hypothetical protein